MTKSPTCVNCQSMSFKVSTKYLGASECVDCGFLASLNLVQATIVAPLLADDPQEAFLCESCQ